MVEFASKDQDNLRLPASALGKALTGENLKNVRVIELNDEAMKNSKLIERGFHEIVNTWARLVTRCSRWCQPASLIDQVRNPIGAQTGSGNSGQRLYMIKKLLPDRLVNVGRPLRTEG